jgi:hypothetical protein
VSAVALVVVVVVVAIAADVAGVVVAAAAAADAALQATQLASRHMAKLGGGFLHKVAVVGAVVHVLCKEERWLVLHGWAKQR